MAAFAKGGGSESRAVANCVDASCSRIFSICDQLCVAQGRASSVTSESTRRLGSHHHRMQRVFSGTLHQESSAASGTKKAMLMESLHFRTRIGHV
jgi:hypothetical protein